MYIYANYAIVFRNRNKIQLKTIIVNSQLDMATQ